MKKLNLLFFLVTILMVTTLYGQDEFDSLRKKASELSPTSLISVSVGGDFFINGTFSAFINERLDHFLTRVVFTSIGGSNGDDQSLSTSNQLSMLMEQTVKRNIKIVKPNGDFTIVDIEKFYLTGNLDQNPYLQQDDLIIFPTINLETNYVIVDGAVNKRLKFSYVEGDKLSDALLFARGIDAAYGDVESAEIVRVSYNGAETSRDTIALSEAETFKLLPGDIVRVLGDEYNRKDYKVLVVGEVNQPGYVYVTKNSTTLREVINRAGGFNERAWLKYTDLVRGTTPDKKVLQEYLTSAYDKNGQVDQGISLAFKPNIDTERWKMFRTADLYDDQYNLFRLDVDLALSAKNKLVDFSRMEDSTAAENYFPVQDGDVIFVPTKMDLVYVMGQVVKPGQYQFNSKSGFMDYIQRAGGFSESADGESEVYIIKGKTSTWIEADDFVTIEPGDYIWARKDPTRSFNFYLGRVSAITSIIGSIATLVLLVDQLLK